MTTKQSYALHAIHDLSPQEIGKLLHLCNPCTQYVTKPYLLIRFSNNEFDFIYPEPGAVIMLIRVEISHPTRSLTLGTRIGML